MSDQKAGKKLVSPQKKDAVRVPLVLVRDRKSYQGVVAQ